MPGDGAAEARGRERRWPHEPPLRDVQGDHHQHHPHLQLLLHRCGLLPTPPANTAGTATTILLRLRLLRHVRDARRLMLYSVTVAAATQQDIRSSYAAAFATSWRWRTSSSTPTAGTSSRRARRRTF
eukprot:scaffold407_cov245-Prasinococcus_capsulatus_cf.AAC.4